MKYQNSHQMKYKLPLITSKEVKGSDNNGIRSRRHQDMRRNDESNDQTDLQRSVEVRLHTRNMENNTHKSDLQRKKKCGKSW